MTVYRANQLLNDGANKGELLECVESLCKEYGYVQCMMNAKFRDLESGKLALAELQDLIDQLNQKLKSL